MRYSRRRRPELPPSSVTVTTAARSAIGRRPASCLRRATCSLSPLRRVDRPVPPPSATIRTGCAARAASDLNFGPMDRAGVLRRTSGILFKTTPASGRMTRRQSLNLIETVHVPAGDAESRCREHAPTRLTEDRLGSAEEIGCRSVAVESKRANNYRRARRFGQCPMWLEPQASCQIPHARGKAAR